MALNIRLNPPTLIGAEAHTSSAIEVWEDVAMTISKLSDTWALPNSITERTYDIQLVANKVYYVRGRFIFTPGGLQGWSPLFAFTATDNIDIEIELDPPLNIEPPIASLSLPSKDTPHTGLEFKITYPTNINYKVNNVSWIILDAYENVKFASIGDNTHIDSLITHTVLPARESFMMKVAVETGNHSVSMLSTVPFSTGAYNLEELSWNTTLGDYASASPADLYLNLPTGFANTDITILVNSEVKNTFNIVDNHIPLAVPTSGLEFYTIKVVVNMQDGSKRGPIYRYIYNTVEITLPLALPLPLTP